MNPQKFYIGIDIGGTNTKIAMISQSGEITNIRRLLNKEIKLTTDNFLNLIFQEIQDIRKKAAYPFIGIGISSPGLQMKDGRGTLFSINMPLLNNVDLQGYFETRTGLPVVVRNDLVAHSLAESFFGAGRGVERFLSVSLGTGIGHTFILNGIPQLSLGGVSGESGRMILDKLSSDRDSMGVYGTAEAMCGVKAIETLTKQKYDNGQEHSANDVILAANVDKDPIAIEIMSEIARRLGLLLVNLSSIYFPQVISITGGQTEAGSFFLDECRNEFDRLSQGFFSEFLNKSGSNKKIQILKSETGGLTGLLGSIVPLIE